MLNVFSWQAGLPVPSLSTRQILPVVPTWLPRQACQEPISWAQGAVRDAQVQAHRAFTPRSPPAAAEHPC